MLFISPQKLFPFSRYLKFCLNLLLMQHNGLIRKIRLISNFMTSQPRWQTIVIHILSNISRREGNETFGQVIERNMWNNFLEKSYTKCGGETCPSPFSEKLKLSVFLDRLFKILYSLFLLYVHVEGYRKILKLSCRALAFTSY